MVKSFSSRPRGILTAMPKRQKSKAKKTEGAPPFSRSLRKDGNNGKTAIAILAAGKGTRLKSKHPKVLHEVGGKPLLAHVIAAATNVVPAQDVYAIVGHEADRVRQAVAHTGINFI